MSLSGRRATSCSYSKPTQYTIDGAERHLHIPMRRDLDDQLQEREAPLLAPRPSSSPASQCFKVLRGPDLSRHLRITHRVASCFDGASSYPWRQAAGSSANFAATPARGTVHFVWYRVVFPTSRRRYNNIRVGRRVIFGRSGPPLTVPAAARP